MNEALDLYKRELLRWNEKINLIGPEAREHLGEHIGEAVAAAEILKPEREVLDFGSGGGLPAIPMAIVSPKARFHLVEADQKKWAFLKHVVRACKLSAVVYGERLERVQFPEELHFSLITSRAVGDPDRWLPKLALRVEREGRAALFVGSTEVPPIHYFRKLTEHRLARGYLVVFHVEHQ